jgi:hypothetical protein
MEAMKTRTAIISAILFCICMLATCEFTKQIGSSTDVNSTGTLFLNQWRREKVEKQNLITSYERRIDKMQRTKDSLLQVVSEKKQNISALRFKVKYFEDQLKESISKTGTQSVNVSENLLDSLVITENKSDTACDETIHTLEKVVSNRDSVIAFHQQVEINLRDVQKNQELNTTYLTEQLNTALKSDRKKARQNRLLAGGLLILSAFSSALLLTQHLK